MSQVCCNQDCNQGRDCPLRKKEMNNKPVAWMRTWRNGTHDWILDGNGCEGYIPLYTHPVHKPMMVLDGNRVYPAFKELTDEEIADIAVKTDIFDPKWVYLFANSILKKAQEK